MRLMGWPSSSRFIRKMVRKFPSPSDPATLELEPGEMIAYVPLRVPAPTA